MKEVSRIADRLTHRQLAELVGGARETCEGPILAEKLHPLHRGGDYLVHLRCMGCHGRPVVRCSSHEEASALLDQVKVIPQEGDVPLATLEPEPQKRKKRE